MGDLEKDKEPRPADGNSYRFGPFTLDPRRRVVSRGDSPVSLTPKAFDVLYFLVLNPNRLVTKEELLQAVWGSTFVEEGNLTQYISHLRKALGDNSEDDRLIVTIARKGYQLTARVTVVVETPVAVQQAPAEAAEIPKNGARFPEMAAIDSASDAPARSQLRKWLAVAALLVVAGAACWLYWSRFRKVAISPSDTIVLADATNATSDPVFDEALAAPLRAEMEQTPYLNVLGNDKIGGALAQLKLAPATKLTPEVARQVCTRTNSKLVISQSISDAGNGYRLQLRALDCGSGRTLAREQADIVARNNVVHELGVAGARLRAELGEPADSVARFDPPLETALSPSLEALQISGQAFKLAIGGDPAGAIKLYERAVELDPNLALAWQSLGANYLITGNTEASAAAYTRAYQLRDKLTEKSRLGTEITYYSNVVGDWDKAYSSALRLLEIFPRDVFGRTNLRAAFIHLGQPGRGADEASEIARMRPSAYYYGSAIQSIRYASRFNDAKSWLEKADALKLDSLLIRRERLIVAFATGDRESVEKILKEEEQGSHREDFLHEHSLIEIQQGRFQSAERLRLRALGPKTTTDSSDWWTVVSAIEDAEVGKDAEARRLESKEAGSALDREGKISLAFAFARSGRAAEAGAIADQVSAERPEDTQVQHYFVPTIRAAIALHQHNPAAAIELLRGTAKYDLAFTGTYDYVYPAYLRGLAYLQLGDGRSAAAEFQKQIDNPGFSVRHVIGPLAWLQLARAQKMMGDDAAARKSYETFLDLWKSADPDIPIYQHAKAEYAKFPK
jgi:DNA-binding winged helix-turn-helix (wHTH) protein/predicted negative regulator of RcsB-dependent stress response